MDRREQAAEDQAAQQQAAAQPAPSSGGGDDVAKLQELATLHASGALTDEEFAAAKAKILG
ncbi:MAG: SHOCT domain-containing protein [Acidimicrobiia bacterium]